MVLFLEKVHADSLFVLISELSRAESLQHGGFPDATVADDDNLDCRCKSVVGHATSTSRWHAATGHCTSNAGAIKQRVLSKSSQLILSETASVPLESQ